MTTSKDMFMEEREFELMQNIPVSKQGIQIKAEKAVDRILETGDACGYAQMLSAMEGFVSAVKKDDRFISAVIEEANKEKGKLTLSTGTKIEVAEVGTKYDYSHDHDWTQFENVIKDMRDKQKQREDFLKKIPPGKQLIDDDGIIIGVGPAKSSTTNFKVTLSK